MFVINPKTLTPELKNVFDGNPSTWWHTQWIGKIPPHPHEIQLDLGNKSSFSTMRYLPAVIINNKIPLQMHLVLLQQ